MFSKVLLIISIVLFSLQSQANTLNEINSQLQPKQMHEDLDQWLAFIERTHPDLSYTVKDTKLFYQNIAQLKTQLNKPLSMLEFWRKVSVFNGQLSDGHTLITFDSFKKLSMEFVKNGGALFPFEVVFDGKKMMIKAQLSGQESKFSGYTIESINDVSIEEVLAPLFLRTHSDNVNQRRAVLAKRFASYYWLFYGEEKEFVLNIKNEQSGKKETLIAKASSTMAKREKTFDNSFQFKTINKDTALLTINSFTWREDEARVFEFFESAFKQIKTQQFKHLIIDIRENGGGDDNIWKKGILPYIADKSWKSGSNYKVKILAGRVDEGEKVGDVVEGEISTVVPVDSENLYKFTGKVSVLIGPYTYSSSILFANVMQDHDFAELIGKYTGGKTGQTGGTQHFTLPNSKLHTVAPRFLLARPKGGQMKMPLTLDKQINYSMVEPSQLIHKLLAN